jgi:hypothetical protein
LPAAIRLAPVNHGYALAAIEARPPHPALVADGAEMLIDAEKWIRNSRPILRATSRASCWYPTWQRSQKPNTGRDDHEDTKR